MADFVALGAGLDQATPAGRLDNNGDKLFKSRTARGAQYPANEAHG